jgi:hypothetical protein
MIRRLTAPIALLTLVAASVSAQDNPPVRLELTPKAVSVPALKYYLYPQVRDQNPGNAVFLYLRAMNPESFQAVQRDAKRYERLYELGHKSVGELTPAELKELNVVLGWKFLDDVDRAARRPYYDWELTDQLRKEGIALRLTDVQSMRSLGVLVRARARAELAAGNFDKAAHTLQTGLAMGRHAANGPTLIQGLVGVAIASMVMDVVEDWVGQPDAPNLYWALTDLPHPLVDLRAGFEGERVWLDAMFPGYREMIADPTLPTPSPEQLAKYFRDTNSLTSGPGLGHDLWLFLLALQEYPNAKKFLREHGRTDEQIAAMPVLHAVLLYEVYKYDVAYDDLRKSKGLPLIEAVTRARQSSRKFAANQKNHIRDLAGELLPAAERVLFAPARIERKIAALRSVEAIRMHAAAHGGQLPEKLADVTEVPVPVDPWTGKPFEYHREDGKATLTGPTPPGELSFPIYNIRYELTIRSAKGEK